MCTLSGQTEVPLSLVEVKVEKLVISETGKKVQSMDSAMMQQYRMQSLGDLLSAGTSVFVKSYGPGAISSSTFRGGSAAHTAMMWHGIHIQNAMLGQTDLSSLPVFLFNDVKVEYGGSSSLWGSGAVAGSIHLDNALSPGPNQTGIFLSGGSFDLNRQGFSQAFNVNKCQSMTKLYRSHALNNYPYRNVSAFEGMKNLQQAREDLAGWMQDVKWQINNRQLLTVKAWVNTNRREVANYQDLPSQARQNDQAVRFVADWLYLKSKISSGIKLAYLRDGIQYKDSLARIDSKSTVHTFVAEEQTYYSRGKNHFQLGANYTAYLAQTNNYVNTQSLQKAALMLGDFLVLMQSRLKINAAMRLEAFSNGALPVTGNVSAAYKLKNYFVFQINAAQIYRQPSLNELYWQPGGNLHLKPEQGQTYEGNVLCSRNIRQWHLAAQLSAFSRQIQNWILWTPGLNAQPYANNVQAVWSRGTETHWEISYKQKNHEIGLQANSAYVLATVAADKLVESAALGKQLIYTPRYLYNGFLFARFRQIVLSYNQQYVGYRFITADNRQWLNPYTVGNVRLSANYNFKQTQSTVYVMCQNIFNQSYAVMAMRPMPYRHFEIGLNIIFNQKKQS